MQKEWKKKFQQITLFLCFSSVENRWFYQDVQTAEFQLVALIIILSRAFLKTQAWGKISRQEPEFWWLWGHRVVFLLVPFIWQRSNLDWSHTGRGWSEVRRSWETDDLCSVLHPATAHTPSNASGLHKKSKSETFTTLHVLHRWVEVVILWWSDLLQSVGDMIHPRRRDVTSFLWNHLEKDIRVLGDALDQNLNNTAITVHLILRVCADSERPTGDVQEHVPLSYMHAHCSGVEV